MPLPARRSDRPARDFGRLAALLLTAIAAGTGCAGGPLSNLGIARDKTIARPISDEEMGDQRNLMTRWLSPRAPASTADDDPKGLVRTREGWGPRKFEKDPVADAEFQAALELFQKGEFPEAESAFARIARKRKDTPWGEKGQYYLAETRYQRGNFVGAHDAFEELFKVYPATVFLEKAVDREYKIGESWMAYYDPKSPDSKVPWYARFTGRLPYIAPGGNAVAVLEHVRHHDPTGPLSDDAVIKIADYHKEAGDYETAAIYYDQLITDHPKSPMLQKAQLEAIDARMKGYLGPEFDGTALEEARNLVRQTMATFPDRPAGNEDLYHTIDLINDQDAERNYRTGMFYRKLGKVPAAEYYLGKVARRWPKTEWGVSARKELVTLAKMPRTESLPSKILTPPGAPDPTAGAAGGGGMGSMMSMPGMSMGGIQ